MAKAELGGVEVKKKRYLVMTVAAVLIMAAVAASAYVLQKKRETPEDRALRKSSEAASEETDSEASGNKTGEKISEKEGVGDNVLMVALVFYKIRLPEIVHGEDEEEVGEGGARGLWSHKLFIFGIVSLFCYEIAEISINSFFINYVVDDGWMNARDASVVLSFGGLGLFMCGRFAGSWIMRYIRAEKVLFFCAVGTVITTALVVLDLGVLSLVALFMGYAFEAIMFPTIFALSLRGLGNYTKRASSYLMMSPIGGAVGPLMMGYVADQTNMSFSFIVPLLSFVVVLLYAWKVKQRSLC